MSRTKWGQNFLIDPNWQRKIAQEVIDAHRQEPALCCAEIGPGRGAITDHLNAEIPDLEVFEIDPILAERHRARNRVRGDFLKWEFDGRERLFVGNLPYESGTEMVLRLARNPRQCPHFLFMLQKEIVERICARPQSKAYGFLSVMVQSQYEVVSRGRIPPTAFKPAPKVWSELVRGVRRREPLAPMSESFEGLLKCCFRHKRKMLRNNLIESYGADRIDSAFSKLHISLKARAEELEVAVFTQLEIELRQ